MRYILIIFFCFSITLPAVSDAAAMVDGEPAWEEKLDRELLGADDWMQKGLELNGLGRFEEAADAFRQAIAINPEDAVAWFSLGTATAFNGNYEEAVGLLKQAVNFDPDFMVAYSNLGAVYGRLGRFKEAHDAYCQVLRLNPDDADARYNRGIVSAGLGDRESALKDYQLLLAVDKELAANLLEFIGQE